MNHSDCIFGLATSHGRSALHLTRISGNGVFDILLDHLRSPVSKKSVSKAGIFGENLSGKPVSRYLTVVTNTGQVIDDAMVTFFVGPHSYTGEDSVEICTHGNPLILSQLHSSLRGSKIRDACPGEFTQRAFLNGKLDLTQAEAINELIHAETEGALVLARNVNEGILSETVEAFRGPIIEILAYLEAHIDFAPDEVGSYSPEHLIPKLTHLQQKLSELASTYANGLKVREGVKVALCGRPNVGKSSLYNALLNANKAIVTDIPGTTRDVLTERFILEKRDFVLLDTAGLRNTVDIVEIFGIQKSRESAEAAHIVVIVVDVFQCPKEIAIQEFVEKEIREVTLSLTKVSEKKILVALTKSDLFSLRDAKFAENASRVSDSAVQFVAASAMDGEISELRNALIRSYDELTQFGSLQLNPTLISVRQCDKVKAALDFLEEAIELIENEDFPEKIASVLNGAKESLQEIIGEVSLDSVFESIFSTFCIGK